MGESGQTFKGMMCWIERAKPCIAIIENICGAPWNEKVKLFEQIGYAATFKKVDSKKFYM